jgi:hypothetical protein
VKQKLKFMVERANTTAVLQSLQQTPVTTAVDNMLNETLPEIITFSSTL